MSVSTEDRQIVLAAAGKQYNALGQIVGRQFFVDSMQDITVVDEFAPEREIQTCKRHALMGTRIDCRNAVKVSGVVTYVSDKDLYFRGEKLSKFRRPCAGFGRGLPPCGATGCS